MYAYALSTLTITTTTLIHLTVRGVFCGLCMRVYYTDMYECRSLRKKYHIDQKKKKKKGKKTNVVVINIK
jgi:hypothetical protein